MRVYFIIVAVSSVLSKNVERKEEPQKLIYQTIAKPSIPVAFVFQLGLNASNNYINDIDNPKNGSLSKVGVRLPDLPCTVHNDCIVYDTSLICVDGQCTCDSPLCWVYHHESSAWTSRNVFSCAECGQLGSSCNDSRSCDPPGECWVDNYCHCPTGENYDGICIVIDDSWAYKFTLAGFGIVFLVSFLVILVHLYKNRAWNQNGLWCCFLCKKTREAGRQDASCEKSPAYTVRNHYASQLCDLSNEAGPETSSTSFQHQYSGARASTSSGRARSGSITSAETESTSVSETSLRTIQNRNGVEANVNLQSAESFSTADTAVDSQIAGSGFNASSEENVNCDNPSPDSTSNCSHERCQLCLPKGLSERENSKTSATDYDNGGFISDSATDHSHGNVDEHQCVAEFVNVEEENTSL